MVGEARHGHVAGEIFVGLVGRQIVVGRLEVFGFAASGFAPDVSASQHGREAEDGSDCGEPADYGHCPNPLISLGSGSLL